MGNECTGCTNHNQKHDFHDVIYEGEYSGICVPRITKNEYGQKNCFLRNSSLPNKHSNNSNPNYRTLSSLDLISNKSIIHKHFAANGYTIVESSKSKAIPGLKNLTYMIGDNYIYTSDFLKEVRKSICTPNAKGERILIFQIGKESGGFFHQFSRALKRYGLFSKYFINGDMLTATISTVPRVLSYFTGQWLEMYCTYVLEDVVGEYAKENSFDHEILMNVKVSNTASCYLYAHELDCVISIADKCFAFEVKSGQFNDYSNLYQTRKELKFVPDKYLLLSTSLDEETAETLQYFYEFFITGIHGFRRCLRKMLNMAFEQ